jgi:hypothetical protein
VDYPEILPFYQNSLKNTLTNLGIGVEGDYPVILLLHQNLLKNTSTNPGVGLDFHLINSHQNWSKKGIKQLPLFRQNLGIGITNQFAKMVLLGYIVKSVKKCVKVRNRSTGMITKFGTVFLKQT